MQIQFISFHILASDAECSKLSSIIKYVQSLLNMICLYQ